MGRQSLDSIFDPSSVAVVGASDQPNSVGGAVFANLRSSPLRDHVFAVNRKHSVVQGAAAYASLSELPEKPDLVVVCTPAVTVPVLAHEFGQMGGRGMIVISAGFREVGAAGRELEDQLRAVHREFPKLRMVGPNCLGVLRPANGLNASFSPVMPQKGGLTFLSQSGALVTAILDWSVERDIGFAACVSTGNMVNVGMGDLIDHFAADDQTEALLLYIEGLDDPRHFMTAARACTRRKPVIAYKSGRFAESSQAAASHTGAIASLDAVYDTALRRAGVERVDSIEELFDCARLLVGRSHSSGERLAIVTNAGGPGVMACDAWLARHGHLAQLSPDSIARLDRVLPPCWSHANPLDVLGDASADRYRTAMEVALADANVDAMLVILTPQTMTEPARVAEAVIAARGRTSKPVVASWLGGQAVKAGQQLLKEAGVPVYEFPEEAVDALSHLASSSRLREAAAYYLPTSSPTIGMLPAISGSKDTASIAPADKWKVRLASSRGLLGEVQSKELFSDYGIPVVPTCVAHSAEEAASLAERQKFPVVMKILSPDISHKTDAGGVLLNLPNVDAVRSGYSQIMSAVKRHNPQARIEGVAVQPMVSAVRGIELLLGMTRDPGFGPVILLGAGGVTAELQRDSVLELPPVDDGRIDRMLSSLRLYPLLKGYRGRPGVNLAGLRDVVARFVQLVEDLPELATAEINPLLVTAEDVVALDARLISRGETIASPSKFFHLAIRPYPREWERPIQLRDGTAVLIRPATPADESGWLAWLQRPESRQWMSRTRSLWWADFQRIPERGCYLDYDNELLLVATDEMGEWRGVAFLRRQRPVHSPDESTKSISLASFDVVVREDSRHAGLGGKMLELGVEIAKSWKATALGVRFHELGPVEKDWLLRHGFIEEAAASGLRLRRPL